MKLSRIVALSLSITSIANSSSLYKTQSISSSKNVKIKAVSPGSLGTGHQLLPLKFLEQWTRPLFLWERWQLIAWWQALCCTGWPKQSLPPHEIHWNKGSSPGEGYGQPHWIHHAKKNIIEIKQMKKKWTQLRYSSIIGDGRFNHKISTLLAASQILHYENNILLTSFFITSLNLVQTNSTRTFLFHFLTRWCNESKIKKTLKQYSFVKDYDTKLFEPSLLDSKKWWV